MNSSISSWNSSNSSSLSDGGMNVFYNILTPIVGSLGLIGNIITFWILIQPKMKSSVTILLLGLTLFDTLFIFFGLTFIPLEPLFADSSSQTNTKCLLYFWMSLAVDFAQAGSIYFTIAITMERYLVICWPLWSRRHDETKRARYFALTAVILAGLVQLMKLGRKEEECPLGEFEYEYVYLEWPYFILLSVLPVVVLIVFNTCIFMKVKELNSKRVSLQNKPNSNQKKEFSIAMMLLAVVLVYLIFEINFFVMFIIQKGYESVWNKWKVELCSMDIFFDTINSSVNFIIYVAFGSKFREHFAFMMKNIKIRLLGGDKQNDKRKTSFFSSSGVTQGDLISRDSEPAIVKCPLATRNA